MYASGQHGRMQGDVGHDCVIKADLVPSRRLGRESRVRARRRHVSIEERLVKETQGTRKRDLMFKGRGTSLFRLDQRINKSGVSVVARAILSTNSA